MVDVGVGVGVELKGGCDRDGERDGDSQDGEVNTRATSTFPLQQPHFYSTLPL